MANETKNKKCFRCGSSCSGALRVIFPGEKKERPVCYDCYSMILLKNRLSEPYNENEFC